MQDDINRHDSQYILPAQRGNKECLGEKGSRRTGSSELML
jgi:hypothetical protein